MSKSSVSVVTVDGPSGSGKGTVSRMLARELGFHFLDSGALYRLLALEASRRGVALDDESALVSLVGDLDIQFPADVSEDLVLLYGEDVTRGIRTEATGGKASRVATLPGVRKALLKVQQDFAMPPGLVADGRDMGTVVFPLADVKLFLVATSEERAERRYKQLKNNNISVEYDNVLKEIEARDKRDSSRSVAPLRAADDAMTIDTTGIDANAVLSQVRDFVKKQLIQ